VINRRVGQLLFADKVDAFRFGAVMERARCACPLRWSGCQSMKVLDPDLFIAAIALSHGAILVTGNRKHYERIPGLVGEDWLRA
jgi:predicted nucleic acid-binding protein